MPSKKYVYSKRAGRDLTKIYLDTAKKWGRNQADTYDAELLSTVKLLADNPELGRKCDDIRAGYRRHEHGRHIIFFRKRRVDILIVRIIYNGMDIKRHL